MNDATQPALLFFVGLSFSEFAAVMLIYLIAGVIKGIIGFALPLVAVTGGVFFLSVPDAVAAVILPGLVTNIQQASRYGVRALIDTTKRFWLLIITMISTIWLGAFFLMIIPSVYFYIFLGGFTLFFSSVQLAGWRPTISNRLERQMNVLIGLFAGVSGGMTGAWGVPLMLYLNSLELPKDQTTRAGGVAFASGGVMMALAHANTGIFNHQTAWLSAAAIAPAYIGMWLGQNVQEKINRELFRTLALVVLICASLSLLRRALVLW
jgi:uncharacterized membrane protein YfcA